MNRALFFLGAFLFWSQAVPAAERVLDFHGEIRIGAAGSLTVTEIITVQAEGRELRHGIVRDISTEQRDRLGNRLRVPFEVLAVTRNGQVEPYALERLANGRRLRTGSATLLPVGLHEYRITYRTSRRIGFLQDHEELRWNVNGHGWTLPFERLSAEVLMPTPVPAGEMRVEASTGSQRVRARNYQAFVRHGSAAFRITRPLEPGEGLSIVVGFPKGVIAQSRPGERTAAWVESHPASLAGAAGIGALGLLLLLMWRLLGRGPQAVPQLPRHEPPAGLGPGAADWLEHGRCDPRAFAAALLGLGANGYLKIRERGERFEIERTTKSPDGSDPEQRILLGLFAAGESAVVIDRQPSAMLEAVRTDFELALHQHFGPRVFSRHREVQAVGWMIAAATLGAMLMLDADRLLFLSVGLPMAAALLALHCLPVYSIEGRKLQDVLQGLRGYLGVAKGQELASPRVPAQTAEEFARRLPYAVALDLEKPWTDRLAALGSDVLVHAEYYESSDRSYESLARFIASLSPQAVDTAPVEMKARMEGLPTPVYSLAPVHQLK